MRLVSFVTSTIITLLLIFALNKKWGSIPALGKFLSPQQGFWQNAEATDHDFSENLSFNNLKDKVDVYIDNRLVPHIFAKNDEDAYFVQGYLHAKFRLWQMEFQTMAAAGRVSEVLGSDPRFLRYDREQRRLGMVYAAENAAKETEKDPASKAAVTAYSAGVNAYVNSLTESSLPIEYKLLGYHPEQWSTLKVALFLKMMSKDLAGFERDLEFTNAKNVFNTDELDIIFPQYSDSLAPIIPKGTFFDTAAVKPIIPPTADSLYFKKDTTIKAVEVNKPDRTNGSNNWALSGTRTQSGAPILCNDPHLGLTLPSIWFEMQISTPDHNVYGATFPGAPTVIIGFNDNVAFGFTNAMRDVKDYYQVKFKDDTKKEYWYNGEWQPTSQRIELVKVRDAADFYDTVAYTTFGPVMYDQSFVSDSTNNTAIAVRWIAHEPSNEISMWLKLNKAKSYSDCEEAIKNFVCPGQNMLFASKSGDIALWQQGKFPARWRGQGLYIMPGEDSSFQWQGYIPQNENPHVINPPEGFIQSANQQPTDSTYPYFIPGNYIVSRGITLNQRLQNLYGATPQDMMTLQNDYFNSMAEDFVPLLLKYTDETKLTGQGKKYLNEVKNWNFFATPDSRATTIYQVWVDSLKKRVWEDQFSNIIQPSLSAGVRPDEQTLAEALLKDSAFKYVDNVNTPAIETLYDQVTAALNCTTDSLAKEEKENGLVWWKHKKPTIYHLLRTAVLPFAYTDMPVGGWSNTINAIKSTHGPSWRMIVHLTATTEAYGVYPGGQSGNPGSKYYQNFVDSWIKGKYYTLWMMKEEEQGDKRIKGKMSFSNS
jgi:penicillin G amidase